MFPCSRGHPDLLFISHIRTCEAGHTAKKRAKVLLFFELTKYFSKKNQKKCILHDLRAILHI